MAIERVYTPMGYELKVHGYDREEVSDRVRNDIVPYWADYCNSHWLSSNHEDAFCPERRVKAFLDRCGTLMLFGMAGIETKSKEISRMAKEIPMSDLPLTTQKAIDSGQSETKIPDEWLETHAAEKEKRRPSAAKKKLPRKETSFDRAQQIRKDYPNARTEICIVDTLGIFTYDGYQYSVNGFPQYGSRPTEEGDFYAMDRVTVVDLGIIVRLYDQSLIFLGEYPKAGAING